MSTKTINAQAFIQSNTVALFYCSCCCLIRMCSNNRQGYKLFVSNIPFSSGYQEIHDTFSEFGPIKNCALPSKRGPRGTHKSSGTARITYYNLQSMQNALSKDSCLKMEGRSLRIQFVLSKRDKTQPTTPILKSPLVHYSDAATHNYHLTAIPSVAWLQILSLLDISSMCRVESTCRFLHIICRQCWYTLTSLSFRNVFSLWEFKSTVGLTNELLAIFLSRTGPSLLSLDISGSARFLSPSSLHVISHYTPQLSTLDLSGITLTIDSVQNFFPSCQSLRNLSLMGCTGLSEKVLWWIIKSRRDLVSLNICENKRVSGNCFIMLSGCLLHFNARSCSRLSPQGLRNLCSTSRSLLSLDLKYCYSLTPQSLRDINQCTNLLSLRFPNVLEASTPSLPCLPKLCTIHTLQSLELCHQLQLTDSFLLSLVHLPKLTSLIIPGCYLVTDIGISHLNHCPLLSSLNISYLNLITDSSLLGLQLDLHSLTARMCPQITQLGLSSVIESSTSLVYLDVSSCENVTAGCLPSLSAHLEKYPSVSTLPPYWVFGGTGVTEGEVNDFFEETGVRIMLHDLSNQSLAFSINTDIFIPAPWVEEGSDDVITEQTDDVITEHNDCLETVNSIAEMEPDQIPPPPPITGDIIIPCEENWDDDCAPPFFLDKKVVVLADYSNESNQFDDDIELDQDFFFDDATHLSFDLRI